MTPDKQEGARVRSWKVWNRHDQSSDGPYHYSRVDGPPANGERAIETEPIVRALQRAATDLANASERVDLDGWAKLSSDLAQTATDTQALIEQLQGEEERDG